MRFLKVLILVVVFFLILVFFIQNNAILTTPMELSWNWYLGPIWTSVPVPFYFVVMLGFLVGACLTWVLLLLGNLKTKQALRHQRKIIRVLEKEVAAIRAASLKTILAEKKVLEAGTVIELTAAQAGPAVGEYVGGYEPDATKNS